jgi:hypothetical protein
MGVHDDAGIRSIDGVGAKEIAEPMFFETSAFITATSPPESAGKASLCAADEVDGLGRANSAQADAVISRQGSESKVKG